MLLLPMLAAILAMNPGSATEPIFYAVSTDDPVLQAGDTFVTVNAVAVINRNEAGELHCLDLSVPTESYARICMTPSEWEPVFAQADGEPPALNNQRGQSYAEFISDLRFATDMPPDDIPDVTVPDDDIVVAPEG